MEIIVTLVVAGLLVALCLVVLVRRSRGSSGHHGNSHAPSGAEVDAQSRAGSQRGSDRQGLGPF